jgi:hypothetical protein
MLMGLTLRTAGLSGRGAAAPFLVSDAGDGNSSFALGVGDNGVGKPGYFLPISVKSDRLGRTVSGCGKVAGKPPMLRTGLLPIYFVVVKWLLTDPSSVGINDRS